MGFKIVQEQADEPKYCDYIQEKIDIAKQNGAVYELVDEDYRIQALYDNEDLLIKDNIKQISRVKVNQENGKEYIVVNKSVDFFTRDQVDKNEIGDYKDRYVTREGIVEIPVKTASIAGQSNSEAATPTRIKYTIPFSKEEVDKYNKNNDGITYTFYEGATSSNRLPSSVPTVTNVDYFKNATWDELLLGREKKVLNSMVNRLPEVRAELNKGQPKEEVNNKKEDNQVIENKKETIERTEIKSTDKPVIQPLNKPIPKQNINPPTNKKD